MSQSPQKSWQGRYLALTLLGDQPGAPTYLALDQDSGQEVIIKELHLASLKDWKRLELFEREARTLEHLQHPGVPRLLAFFRSDDQTQLCLVVEKLPGKSLLSWLEAGWRPNEAEVQDIASQILEILVYLHGLQPPVIHRDLKPSNLLRQDNGKLQLVDFGAAQHLLHPEGGRTVVGTFGYMAPEQFSGQATAQSDLYGLGASLVHLLSGRSPAELPFEHQTLRFQGHVSCSDSFSQWLAQLLAAEPSQRFASAQAALAALQNPQQQNLAAAQPKPASPLSGRKRWLLMGLVVGPVCLGGLYALQNKLPWGLGAASRCFSAPLLKLPPQSGAEAEAFRQDFRQRFPLPPELVNLSTPAVTHLDELEALWRCQPSRSQADPVFFKTAWELILHSPLNDYTVASAINLMSWTQPHYPQLLDLMKFAVERYHTLNSVSSWDQPGRVAAGLVEKYARRLNLQGEHQQALPWLEQILRERETEINDHQLQLLSYEYAYALWKNGQPEEALQVLQHALSAYPEGSWDEKLQKLQQDIGK